MRTHFCERKLQEPGTTAGFTGIGKDASEDERPTVGTYSTFTAAASGAPYLKCADEAILSQASDAIRKVDDIHMRQVFIALLLALQNALGNAPEGIANSRHLPPLHFYMGDDGALLLEWIFKDFRVGFVIESDVSESSWYLVSNSNLGNINRADTLRVENMDALAHSVTSFVMENT